MRRSRHSLIAAATLLAVAVPVGDHAAAAPLENVDYHDEFNFVSTDFCGVGGLSVQFDVVLDGHVLVALRGPGRFPLFQDVQHGSAQLTNLASGASMTIRWDTIDKDASLRDNGDGTTLTLETMSVGHFSFRDGDGNLVGLNGGGFWSELLYDYAGTPSDLSDDTVTFIGDTKVVGREDSSHADSCPFSLSILG